MNSNQFKKEINEQEHTGSVKSRIHDTCLVAEPVTIAIEGKVIELSLRDAKALLSGLQDAVARVEQAAAELVVDGLNCHATILGATSGGTSRPRTKLGEDGVIYIDPMGDTALRDELFVRCREAGRNGDFVDVSEWQWPRHADHGRD